MISFVVHGWKQLHTFFNISIDDELYPQGGRPAIVLKPTPTNWKEILEELKQQIRQEYLFGDIVTLNNPRGFRQTFIRVNQWMKICPQL